MKRKSSVPASSGLAVRDRRQPGWLWVHNEVIDRYGQELGPIAIAVYVALTRYASNDTQQCWPTHKTLAEKAGISVSSVKRAISKLVALKLVHVERRFTEQGDPTSNRYTLLRIGPTQSARSPAEAAESRPSVQVEPSSVPRGLRTRLSELDISERDTSEGLAPTPVTFEGWLDLVRRRTGRQRITTLHWMFKTLYPGHEPPEYGYLAQVARRVGGPERLAQLLWEYATRPPVGDVLAYLQQVARGTTRDDTASQAAGESPLSMEHEAERTLLQQYFSQETGLRLPRGANDVDWWRPLETIGELADWDMAKARRLIDRALDQMEGLHVVAPRSVVNMANAMAAEETRLTAEQRRHFDRLRRLEAQSDARFGVVSRRRETG
jgi:DNA-binding MarR family transcriptional regulator